MKVKIMLQLALAVNGAIFKLLDRANSAKESMNRARFQSEKDGIDRENLVENCIRTIERSAAQVEVLKAVLKALNGDIRDIESL